MKKFLISALTLFSLTSPMAFADEKAAEALLHQMNEASQQLNYELSYILIKKNSIEPLLYRHARGEQEHYAHLVYLSGPVREVIRRGNEVSYIEPGVEPFTIESGEMVAPTIPLLNSDADELSEYYDFIKVGRAREAGTACQVLRVVPKDGLRYSYILWVDEKTKLPLRADLIDRDGEVLEQYRTIAYSVSDRLVEIMSGLKNVKLPQVISLPKAQERESFWTVSWIPKGFEAKELNRYRMGVTDRMVESQMYSDGLFSFSIYVSQRDDHSLKGQIVRQGRRTLHSYVRGDAEISVVGDIPPETAKRIAQSVTINAPTEK
ncbi:sigma-E factor regulatory protein RseB [Vibrio panuliri]|uniref:Sigma-E factor regulatory protein RseB n=1 Tax=Vibrio panuliri TaxID=1381081 RepID=A0A1Q9HH23_9VIBR|nr:sigma-E factor regulatory protein RseB [Vibrio panuliri]KAB1460071.1 sigma-E factor regulatory protein RseB [Vibrio panuliri]OLQ89263.1 sigma-E factor regulatory protein RseB [Vibrio panuliri]OLQ96473.1 sigma-E factor regulatory protein RseB [Vibrio panuliri]